MISLFGHVCSEHKYANMLAPNAFQFQIVFVCSFGIIAATIAITHQSEYFAYVQSFIVSICCKMHFILVFVINSNTLCRSPVVLLMKRTAVTSIGCQAGAFNRCFVSFYLFCRSFFSIGILMSFQTNSIETNVYS